MKRKTDPFDEIGKKLSTYVPEDEEAKKNISLVWEKLKKILDWRRQISKTKKDTNSV